MEIYGRDEEEQEKIRLMHKGENHCKFLKDSCRACDELPYDIGQEKAGNPCPNNPFFKYKELVEEQEDNSGVITEAKEWESLMELGMLPKVDEVTAIQFAFLTVVSKFMKAQDIMSGSLMGGMMGSAQTHPSGKPEFPKKG